MPLDAVCISAVAKELREQIIGARTDKIQQPERDEIILNMRGAGSFRLLLSASPNNPRAHITNKRKENPDEPPMFCMLLRKHLQGAVLRAILQPPMERTLSFVFDARNEIGERSEKRLIAELIGRQSNIILCDGEGRIIDCIRRVYTDMSVRRQLSPGLFYEAPPKQEKNNPLAVTMAEAEALLELAADETELSKWLLDTFNGLSPLVCRELVYGAFGDAGAKKEAMDSDGRTKFLDTFFSFGENIRNELFKAHVLFREGKPYDFSFMPIYQYGDKAELVQKNSFSELLDDFYAARDLNERMRQRGQGITKTVANLRDRAVRKLELQKEELKATYGRERLRELGDIISANFYVLEKGMNRLETEDLYATEGGSVEISLNPLLTPQQNAERYYREYTKAKNAEFFITEQIKKGEGELDYLNSVIEELKRAESETDLEEIRAELSDAGYIRADRKKKIKKAQPRPLCFKSTAGLIIKVGRNNIQNDELTLRNSRRTDMWLHTQKIHGAHVIIESDAAPDDSTLLEAAIIAAYYSQARESKKVPVDFTQVKNVKKPSGAKPGMVIYSKFKTLIVDPDLSVVDKLKA